MTFKQRSLGIEIYVNNIQSRLAERHKAALFIRHGQWNYFSVSDSVGRGLGLKCLVLPSAMLLVLFTCIR